MSLFGLCGAELSPFGPSVTNPIGLRSTAPARSVPRSTHTTAIKRNIEPLTAGHSLLGPAHVIAYPPSTPPPTPPSPALRLVQLNKALLSPNNTPGPRTKLLILKQFIEPSPVWRMSLANDYVSLSKEAGRRQADVRDSAEKAASLIKANQPHAFADLATGRSIG